MVFCKYNCKSKKEKIIADTFRYDKSFKIFLYVSYKIYHINISHYYR